MLQRMQAEIGQLLRLRMGEDGDDSALVMKFIESHLAIALSFQLTTP